MDEKEQLKAILALIDNKDGKLFKKMRLRITFAVALMFILTLMILFFPNFVGIQIQSFGFIIFFIFGMAVARWDSLNKLKRLLPYFNKQTMKNRLSEIDA